jgi:hypothetical protein
MDDDRVSRLKNPEECAAFERNAVRLNEPELASSARRRAVELRALQHGAKTQAERECLEAVYAYEEVLSAKNGRTTRATRTWQMIDRRGIIGAVERAVNRPEETVGYTALKEKGLEQYAFEAVIIRHPSLFSADAIRRSEERVASWSAKSSNPRA